jgi:hypothetical protein
MDGTRHQLKRALELLGVPRDGDADGQRAFRETPAGELRRRMESASREIASALVDEHAFWQAAFLAALSADGTNAVDAARVADEALVVATQKGRV